MWELLGGFIILFIILVYTLTAVLDFVDTFKRFTEEIILIRKLIENSESRSLTYYDGLYGTKTIKTTTFVGGIHNEKD